MSYLIMETKVSYCVALDENGKFIKAANMNYSVGDRVAHIYPMAQKENKSKGKIVPILAGFASIAAVFVIVLSTLLGTSKVYGNIYFTVNPEVRIGVAKDSKVLELQPLNTDGEVLVLDYNYSGKDVFEVANYLVQQSAKENFLKDGGNVSLAIESADEGWYKEMGVAIRDKVSGNLDNKKVNIFVDKYGEENLIPPEEKLPEESPVVVDEVKEEVTESEKKPDLPEKIIPPVTPDETPKAEEPVQDSKITQEQALAIAYNHAEVSADEITKTKAEKDTDNGQLIYEIEFETKSGKYKYEISSVNGDILKYETDVKNKNAAKEEVTKSGAIEIALGEAGFSASEVKKMESEYDDGYFEVEFEVNGTEYKYKIDAATGKIIKKEID